MASLVVMIEGLIAVAATSLAWGCRRSGSLVLLMCGVFLGMASCASLHGLCFGRLRVEGPHAERDPPLLAGYGLVAAVFAGIPLGTVLGLALGIASRYAERRRAARFRERVEKPAERASGP